MVAKPLTGIILDRNLKKNSRSLQIMTSLGNIGGNFYCTTEFMIKIPMLLNWDTGIRSHPENFLRCLLREGIFFLTHTYFYDII